MRNIAESASCLMVVIASLNHATADEVSSDAIDHSRVVSAIRKSIPLLEKAATGSAQQKKCFTCHSQALPVVALAEARLHGFAIDEAVFQTQLRHTAEHLKRGQNGYMKGRGQGGRALTAGYALWTLEAGNWKPDDVTSAVVHYLTDYQKDDKRWHHGGSRPPSSGSDFATTYFALRASKVFSTDEQQNAVDERLSLVSDWLESAEPKDTEDQVFQLRALSYLNTDAPIIDLSRAELIKAQRPDGGWSQNPEMTSDAYATGTVLVALLRTGSAASDDTINRGIYYLLDSQQDDGSWHVVTRAKPFQTYYETGFPHGKDQFISTSASAWATIALVLTQPLAKVSGE